MVRPKIAPTKIPAWAWKRLKAPARKPQAGPHKLPTWFWAWRKWIYSVHKWVVTPAPPKPKEFVMYDSVDVSQIPLSAVAVAGYVGGNWVTIPRLQQLYPDAKKLTIAVNASEDAECLDIENGDATPDEAAAWVKRQHARGVKRPAVYCSLAIAWTVWWKLRRAGIKRKQVRIFTAHYTYKPHRCSPLCHFGFWTKADATQFTDKSMGRNLDASLCAPNFFN